MYNPYWAAADEADCKDYASDTLRTKQKGYGNSATSILVYTILLALGQVILLARAARLLKHGGSLGQPGDGVFLTVGVPAPNTAQAPPHAMASPVYVQTVQGQAVQGTVVQGRSCRERLCHREQEGACRFRARAAAPSKRFLPSAYPAGDVEASGKMY